MSRPGFDSRRRAALVCMVVSLLAGGSLSACGSARPVIRSLSAAPPVQGGVNLGGYRDYKLSEGPAAARNQTMANIYGSGARWIRVVAPDTTSTDPVIKAALAHGLQVDLLINDDRTADTPAAMATLAATIARQYGPEGVHTYEVLNEPNAKLSASAYTAILRSSYAAIHRLDPAAKVISGGLERTGGSAEPATYLAAMYAAGARGSMDAVGVHPYTFPNLPDHVTAADGLDAVMHAHGDGAKQIWITEFGVPTGTANGYPAFGETFQALSVTRIFAAAQPASRFGPVFVYEWQDDPGGDFGLSDDRGNPKPALKAFTRALCVASRPR